MEVTIKSIVKDKNDKIVETPNGVLCTVDIKGEEQMIVLPRDQLSGMLPDDDNDDTQTSADLTTSSKKSVDKTEWGQDDTRLLLRLYAKYLRNVGPSKQFRSKRLMWTKISDDIYEQTKLRRTWMQCENRYKTILKRKATLQTFSRAKRRRFQDDEYNKTIEMVHKADEEKNEEYKSDNLLNEIVTRPKRRSKYDIDPTWVSGSIKESTSTENLSENGTKKKSHRSEIRRREVREFKKETKDVFRVFGKYIANKLRCMKSHKNQIIAQHQIQDLMFKLEMEDYDEFEKKKEQPILNNTASSSAENTVHDVDLQDLIED